MRYAGTIQTRPQVGAWFTPSPTLLLDDIEAEEAAKPSGSAPIAHDDQASKIIGDVTPFAQSLVEILAGIPQKRERTAKYLAEAAAANAQTSNLAAMGGGSSAPPLGVPWVVWLAAAGVGAWFLLKK